MNQCRDTTGLRPRRPSPQIRRYTVECRWRPPKDHWPLTGAHWRTVVVELDSMDRPEGAACDACLFLIGTRRGQATAVSVQAKDDSAATTVYNITFNWSWYDGTVTWGGHVVGEPA
jgi:hypothetical protein